MFWSIGLNPTPLFLIMACTQAIAALLIHLSRARSNFTHVTHVAFENPYSLLGTSLWGVMRSEH